MAIIDYLIENTNTIKYIFVSNDYEYDDEEEDTSDYQSQAYELVTKTGLRMLRDDNIYVCAIDTNENKVVGFLYYSFDNGEIRWSIGVDDEYRNKGIATKLYTYVNSIPEYDVAEYVIAELISPFTLEQFVIKNGYKKVHEDNNFRVYKKKI